MFSFWQQDTFGGPADVLIAGAGFMGLWCAYELKIRQPGLKITVLDKESFPAGASVRNAGFACFGSPGEMLHDAAAMGEDAMWSIVAMRYQGIYKLRSVLGDDAIAYDACSGYECFTDAPCFRPVADRLEWLNRNMKNITGMHNTFTIADTALPSLGLQQFQHLVVNRLEGGLHSGHTLQTLLQKVMALGVTVLFGVPVLRWEEMAHGFRVMTDTAVPLEINAGCLIVATNAFASTLLTGFPVQPARGQVIITQPIEGLRLKGTFHFEEGFYYWRNVGNRILLGGARNKALAAGNTTEQQVTPVVQEALENFLHRHIGVAPEQIKIAARWSGIMGFTENKLPLICHPAGKVLAVVACNGMGVALAPMMAEKVAGEVLN